VRYFSEMIMVCARHQRFSRVWLPGSRHERPREATLWALPGNLLSLRRVALDSLIEQSNQWDDVIHTQFPGKAKDDELNADRCSHKVHQVALQVGNGCFHVEQHQIAIIANGMMHRALRQSDYWLLTS
jgi:hypothetical protein